MKDDERNFLSLCLAQCGPLGDQFPRDLIRQGVGPNYKRAWYLLEKWTGKGWYDYGVAVDLGWFYPGKIPDTALHG